MSDGPFPDMPESSPELVLIGAILGYLAVRDPEALDEITRSVDGGRAAAMVDRLRGPKVQPRTRRSFELAAAWLRDLRLVVVAMIGEAKLRQGKKHKHEHKHDAKRGHGAEEEKT